MNTGVNLFFEEQCEPKPNTTRAPQRPRRPLILHITGDYPDPVRNRTTYAVKNFIDLLDDCDHLIFSIKRYVRPQDCYRRTFEEGPSRRVHAIGYWGLPGGLFHRHAMRRIAATIRKTLSERGIRPDIVVAHKLTIEGVVAYRLRQKLGLEYVCCVRGEVEDKLFRFKPELRGLFGQVIAKAEMLLYVSAWFAKRIERTYPGHVRRQMFLPNFSVRGAVEQSSVEPAPRRFVTVLDLGMYRRKGFHDLVAGLAEARKRVPDLELDVIGWSTPRVMRRVRALVRKAGVEGAVHFLGVLPHEEVLRAMPRYGAMVLPARNETFGMVYLEALLARTPILYTRDSGIDGYLGGFDVGVSVRVGDVSAIAEGLCSLVFDGARYRRALFRDHRAICARFAPNAYLRDFRNLVDTIQDRTSRMKGYI